jgi:hypothetical protein
MSDSRLKRVATAIGTAAVAYADYNHEVNQMTNELMQRTPGLDLDAAKQVARTLVNRAEVTWK